MTQQYGLSPHGACCQCLINTYSHGPIAMEKVIVPFFATWKIWDWPGIITTPAITSTPNTNLSKSGTRFRKDWPIFKKEYTAAVLANSAFTTRRAPPTRILVRCLYYRMGIIDGRQSAAVYSHNNCLRILRPISHNKRPQVWKRSLLILTPIIEFWDHDFVDCSICLIVHI